MHQEPDHAESGARPSAGAADSSLGSVRRVRVRYWAAAKAAAGVDGEELGGRTVADVLSAARERHRDQPRFDHVLSVCSFLLGERPVGTLDLADVEVADGDTLDVLPPFAGG
jgi:molybdopterin converting factor small subunit